MILLLLAVTVISLCNGYSFQGTTEYVCKEDNSLLENAAQTTQAPYSLSVTYINTKNVLITISSEHKTPFTEFTIQSLYETTSSNQQSQFTLLDESGAPLQKCSSGQLQYTRDLSWTTEDEVVGKVQFVVNVWYNSSTYWVLETSADFPQQVNEGRIPPDPWCGNMKGCLSNCTDVDCEYLVTWFQRDNYTVTFEIYSKLNPFTGGNTWAAVGFSTNQSMPGSSVMMCVNSNNQMLAQSGYTTGHTYAKVDDPKELTKFVRGDTNGNVFHCVMNRTITSMDEKIFDLKQEWFLLFAYGNVVNGVPVHHDFRIASSQPQDFLAPLKVRDIIVPDPWCGKIKGCFSNCTKTECEYIVSWMHDFTTVTFDIQTKVPPGTVYNSWAAIGLSFDQQMSGSSIMMCMSDFGLVRAELGFTTGHTYSRIDDIKSSLKLVNSSLEGSIFRCTMRRDIVSSGDMIFDLRDNWYLLFAHGPLSKGVPMHHDYRIPSDRPFAFLAPLAKPLVHPSVQDSNIPPDPACGKTKACFSNCTANDCQYLISWYHSQSTITFNIQTKITTDIMDSWAAIGLSSNQSMAGSSIMMCLNKDGTMSAEFGYTTGHTYAKLNDTKHTLTFVNGSTVGNIFQCIVQRDINLSTDKIFGLRNEWFLLFAYGPVTNGVPMHHYNKTFSIKAIDFLAVSEKSEPLSHIQPDPSCGKTKGCFTNCTDTDCEYLISWTHDDKTITFDIQTKVVIGDSMNAWAAIGLTAYPSMPGTSVMMCRTKDGTMSAEFGYNPGYIYNKLNDTDHTLKFVGGGTNGNVFHCTVQRDIDISTDKIFSMKTKWYMLFAHGITKEGIPQQHDNKTMSKSAIDFLAKFQSNIGLMRSTKSLIIMKDEPTDNSMIDSVINFQANPGYSVDYLKTFDDQNHHVAVYTVDDVPLDVPLDQNTITLDKDCNVTKGCINTCSNDNCHYVISWVKDGKDVTFNITARVHPGTISRAWMAVGFSRSGEMDGSSTMMCLNVNGTVYGRYGYTGPYWAYHEIKDETLPIVESYTTGDIFHCSVKRPILSTTDHIFNLTEKWHIIFAHGQVGTRRGRVTLEQHDFKFAASTKTDFLAFPVSPTSGKAQETQITPDNGCGVTKSCFDDCNNSHCSYLITWTNDTSDFTFKISAQIKTGSPNTAWVAVGFSPDGNMPRSSMIMCLNVNGTFTGEYGYSTNYTEYKPLINGTLPVKESSMNGDIVQCTIKRPITASSDRIFNLTKEWHILFAYGQVSQGIPQYHDFRIGGSNSINFLELSNGPTTVKPDTTSEMPQSTSSGSAITPDNGCGVTKSCFDDCNNSQCTYLITWTNDTTDVTFKISAQINKGSPNTAWVAVGFSPDGQMPRSSMIMCLNVNGTFTGEYGYSTNYTVYKPLANGTIPVLESSTNGNIVRCTIKRPITASSDRIFNLTKEWHILFAFGQVTVNKGIPSANYHDFRVGGSYTINFLKTSNVPTTVNPETTSPNTPQHMTTSDAPNKITLDPGCGVTKGCFPQCTGTICTSLVTWQKDKDDVIFEIEEDVSRNPVDRWIAIGFSGDQKMGETSVVICQNKGSGDVSVSLGYNDGYSFSVLPAKESVNVLKDTSMSITGQIMRCNFRRAVNSSDPKVYDLKSQWYLLMGNGPITAGTPTRHETTPIATSAKTDFLKFQKVDGGVQASAVIKIHGCLMVSAWILFSSVGVMLARHFKKQWAKTIWNDHKVWFQIHRGCMILAALLTAGGFVLILVENKGFRELAETGEKKFLNYHPIMGIVVFSLTILNPIIAFLRCGPNHEKRPIFNWVHSFIGTSAHILGAVTVGFGVNIPKVGLDSSVNYIIIAYAIAFVVIEFLLHRLTQHNNTSHDKNLYDVGGSSDSFPEQPSEESTGMKMSLFLHVVAMVTCTTILLYKIINS